MSSPVEIVLIIAAVGYVLFRRMIGEPAEGRRMLLLPAALGVIGLSDVQGALHDVTQLTFLVITVLASIVIGGLRGLSIRVSDRDGVVFMQYTAITVVLWVVNLVVKFGANFILQAVDPGAGAGNTLFLTLGVGMLCEGVTVLAKAMRSESRVTWAKGKDGEPDRMSPFLDQLQSRFQDRRP